MAWNPWRALRERPDLTFGIAHLPERLGGAVLVPHPDGATILIDARLGQRERAHALAHEIVHAERGGGAAWTGMPPAWHAVVRRDEHQTEDEAVRRLVPPEDLKRWCRRRSAAGEPVEAHDVADEWHVPEGVGHRALVLLGRRGTV